MKNFNNKINATLNIKMRKDDRQPSVYIDGDQDDVLNLLSYLIFKVLNYKKIGKDDVVGATIAGIVCADLTSLTEEQIDKIEGKVNVINNLDDIKSIIDEIEKEVEEGK